MKAQFTELYSYFTGGVTDESLLAWQQFRAMVPTKDGWEPLCLVANPLYPVEVDGHHSFEPCVMLVFGRGQERLAFVTDGFGWGYGGTGPVGLCKLLAEVLVAYNLVPEHAGLLKYLQRFVIKQPMGQSWASNLRIKAADVLWKITEDVDDH